MSKDGLAPNLALDFIDQEQDLEPVQSKEEISVNKVVNLVRFCVSR